MHIKEVPHILFQEFTVPPRETVNCREHYRSITEPSLFRPENYQDREVEIGRTGYGDLWMRLEPDNYDLARTGLYVNEEYGIADGGGGGFISVVGRTALTDTWAHGRGNQQRQVVEVYSEIGSAFMETLERNIHIGKLVVALSERILEMHQEGVIEESVFFEADLQIEQ